MRNKEKHQRAFDYSKLRGRTAELGLTAKQVAAAAGMTPATYGIKLKGDSDFTQREILDIATFLRIGVEEIEKYFFCGDCSV